eukprot:Rmarinus@m.5100
MGCSWCKPAVKNDVEASTLPVKKSSDKKAPASEVEPLKQLNKEDFIFRQRKDEVLVRKPGDIDGQMFVLDECEGCDIYLMDFSSEVLMDGCRNCRIFIGPCESSVFIRDSSDCDMVVACQQFRLRDCRNLKILLYTQTRPIIEESRNIGFGCFDYNYPELRRQFDAAKLSVFNNPWGVVYDFTKGAGHWYFLPENTTHEVLLHTPPESCGTQIEPADGKHLVPLTTSSRQARSSERGFVVFFPPAAATAHAFLDSLPIEFSMVQTGEYSIRDRSRAMFSDKTILKAASVAGTCVGVLLSGDGCAAYCTAAVGRVNTAAGTTAAAAITGEDVLPQVLETFFQQDDMGQSFGGGKALSQVAPTLPPAGASPDLAADEFIEVTMDDM